MPSFGYLFYTLGFTDLVVFCCVRAYEEHQAKSFQMTHRLERLHDFRKKEKNKQTNKSKCVLFVSVVILKVSWAIIMIIIFSMSYVLYDKRAICKQKPSILIQSVRNFYF